MTYFRRVPVPPTLRASSPWLRLAGIAFLLFAARRAAAAPGGGATDLIGELMWVVFLGTPVVAIAFITYEGIRSRFG